MMKSNFIQGLCEIRQSVLVGSLADRALRSLFVYETLPKAVQIIYEARKRTARVRNLTFELSVDEGVGS